MNVHIQANRKLTTKCQILEEELNRIVKSKHFNRKKWDGEDID